MIWLVPLIPLGAGTALWCASRRLHRGGLGAAAVAGLIATLVLAARVGSSQASGEFRWGAGLELTLEAGGLSLVMALLVPLIAAPIVGYAAYHEPERGLHRLIGLLTAFVGAMELLVLAGDLLTLLIGWELVGALSWALIGFEWREVAAVQAAAQAFVPTRFGDLGLFLAAGAAFGSGGSMRFDALASMTGGRRDVLAVGILLAAVAKSGQLPFSPWLFSAMAGPTPVSALLHSATMVAAGAYALARLQPALAGAAWFGPVVIAIGLGTALAGGAVALVQDHGKRMLAASTSAQYGLMFVAIGAGFPGAAGAHLVTQAFFKALLFLAFGVAMQAAGTGDIRAMRLGRALPATAALALVGSLALAAVPPLGGAWSKGAIVAAASEHGPLLGIGVALAGALSAAYATRLHLLAFGRGERQRSAQPTRPEIVAIGVLAAGTIGLSVLWLPGNAARVARISGGRVPEESLALFATGIAATVAGYLVGRALARKPIAVPALYADWLGIPAASQLLIANPTLALARVLADFDGRVVDAGVGAAARVGGGAARLLARRDTLNLDAAVMALGSGGHALARFWGRADDRIVDGAVEWVAAAAGAGGRLARRLQTGMTHQYLLGIAVGIAALIVLARVWR